MEALNKNGQILLDYRKEYKRHYADSVDEALKSAIYTLYKEKRIDERLFRLILNEDVDDLEVYTYLLTQKDYTKSTEELNYEYDVIRQKVNDYLIKIGMVNDISTKNSLSTQRIIIIRQFNVSKEILLSYFGLSPTEIIPLMKRKGFMDKFCVLRLNQIFKEIYSELKLPEHVDHGYSLVYYNKEISGFSIDYKYSINVNYLNDESKMRDVLNKIKETDKICEKKFQNKINFVYFSNQSGSKKQSKIEIEKHIKPIAEPIPAVSNKPVITPPNDLLKDNKTVEQVQKQQEKSTQTAQKSPQRQVQPKQDKQPQQQQKPPQGPKNSQEKTPIQQPKQQEFVEKKPAQKQPQQTPKEEPQKNIVNKPILEDIPVIDVAEEDTDLL